jgi:hypothetical protein
MLEISKKQMKLRNDAAYSCIELCNFDLLWLLLPANDHCVSEAKTK